MSDESEGNWETVLRGGLKDRFFLIQSFHNKVGDFYDLAPLEAQEVYETVEAEEESAGQFHIPPITVIGTVTSADAHMLGVLKSEEGTQDRRKYFNTLRRVTELDLPGFERIKDVSDQFDAFEQARQDAKEMGWQFMKAARTYCISEIILSRGDLLEAEKEKNGGREKLAKATLAKDPRILKAAKDKFLREWKDWHLAPPEDPDELETIKWKPDSAPGAKLRIEWPVFRKHGEKDAEGKPKVLTSRKLDFTNCSPVVPRDKFTQLKAPDIWPIIESQRANQFIMTKHCYVDKNGPIDIDEVLCPNGERMPLWNHPGFQMLRSGMVTKYNVKLKFMDLKRPWWGIKIERVMSEWPVYETFIFNPGHSTVERKRITDSSAAATSVSMRGTIPTTQPSAKATTNQDEEKRDKFIEDQMKGREQPRKVPVTALDEEERVAVLKRKQLEDQERNNNPKEKKKPKKPVEVEINPTQELDDTYEYSSEDAQ
jgi:hypothetical protein